MGASTFVDTIPGTDAREAFHAARERAQHNYGRAGYTGTIAEKRGFVVMGAASGMTAARVQASFYLDQNDDRIASKWGPAGCIEFPGGFVFFGWASD